MYWSVLIRWMKTPRIAWLAPSTPKMQSWLPWGISETLMKYEYQPWSRANLEYGFLMAVRRKWTKQVLRRPEKRYPNNVLIGKSEGIALVQYLLTINIKLFQSIWFLEKFFNQIHPLDQRRMDRKPREALRKREYDRRGPRLRRISNPLFAKLQNFTKNPTAHRYTSTYSHLYQ